jgi:hypothetical protein
MLTFTICSNNYLPEALSLGHSLLKNNLNASKFKIFLVDQLYSDIDYSSFPFEIVKVTEELVKGFDRISVDYKIVELSTAVKPSIFKHLIKSYPTETIFSYFDPDLFFFENVDYLIEELGQSSMLITPHVLEPIPFDHHPFENVFLNYGIYNLGYITIRKDENSLQMLDWWEKRTMTMGYDNVSKGLFVDQLWINLVPIFFKNVKVSFHRGLNVSYWNLVERHVTFKDGKWFVSNGCTPLIFYHYSSFDITLKSVSKRGYKLNDHDKTIKGLMTLYKNELETNGYYRYKKYHPHYELSFENYLKRSLPQQALSKKEVFIIKVIGKFLPAALGEKLTNLVHKVRVISQYTSQKK